MLKNLLKQMQVFDSCTGLNSLDSIHFFFIHLNVKLDFFIIKQLIKAVVWGNKKKILPQGSLYLQSQWQILFNFSPKSFKIFVVLRIFFYLYY